MKLRILGNSIRLRLKRGEVDRIASGDSIVEETHFPDSAFACRLAIADGDSPAADFSAGCISVRLPGDTVRTWAATDQVSIVAELPLPSAGKLALLVEKDFKCLSPGDHRHDDEDSDTFEHPEANTGRGC